MSAGDPMERILFLDKYTRSVLLEAMNPVERIVSRAPQTLIDDLTPEDRAIVDLYNGEGLLLLSSTPEGLRSMWIFPK